MQNHTAVPPPAARRGTAAFGPVVLVPGRGRQRVQRRRDRGGALGGQVPVDDFGAADRGGQLHLSVREPPPPGPGRAGPPRARTCTSANSAARSASPSPPANAA